MRSPTCTTTSRLRTPAASLATTPVSPPGCAYPRAKKLETTDLDLDLMIDLFAGPAVYRLLITGGDMSKMFAVEDQLDALLNGLRPPASPRT